MGLRGALVLVRQVVCFVLGVAVLVDALLATKVALVQWLAGLGLIGILPLDASLAAFLGRRGSQSGTQQQRGGSADSKVSQGGSS